MKALRKVIIFVLATCLFIGLACYSDSFTKSHIHLVDKNEKVTGSLLYHFDIIAEDINGSFWQTVKAGAQKAGNKNRAAVEFNGPVVQNADDEAKCLDIAIMSHVDGIAVYVPDKAKFAPLINKASGKGINVVTFESDAAGSRRKAYIGPNSYDVGAAQGALAAEAKTGGTNNVALILGGNYAVNGDLSSSFLSGFKNSINTHPGVKLLYIKDSSAGYFKAETIIRDILYEHPDINNVVCTSESDTLEVVQVLVDLNRTGSVTVIGYSNSDQIRKYIKDGIIFGSIYEDPEDIGYRSIESLVKLYNKGSVPSVIKTCIYSITENSLAKSIGATNLYGMFFKLPNKSASRF